MKNLRVLPFLFFTAVLGACGGGGGGGSSPPVLPPPAPSGLTYAATPAFTVNTAITALTPTVTGTPTSYAVAPALPAGLTLSATTGIISGTPTAVAATTNYQVTAANAGGSTGVALSLTVNAIAPSVDYPNASYSLITGVAANLAPGSTGGAVVAWSIDHALPAGLSFSAASGTIAGTPTQVSPSGPYLITAQNSGGNDTFVLNIGVTSGVLLELGHDSGVREIIYDGSRIASIDDIKHAVLWDAQSGSMLSSGSGRCDEECGSNIALRGSTFAIRSQAGFDVRAADDGAAVSTIAFPAVRDTWWTLAADGSYLASGDPAGLRVWSRAGALLFSRNGDYSHAKPFAAAGTLRLAAGPGGAALIESIAVPGGTSVLTAPFQGTFHSWYLDGEKFLTTVGNTVFTFSRDIAQLDIAALPTIAGLGGNNASYWTVSGTSLRIYAVGNGATAAATFAIQNGETVSPSGNTLGIFTSGSPQISVVNLAGATPVKTDFFTPVAYVTGYAALSSTEWVFGNVKGVMLGELVGPSDPQLYSRGAALSIAGSAVRFAVATADGDIEYFDSITKTKLGTIEFASSHIAISADGTLLAAAADDTNAQFTPDRTLRFYALPSGSLITQWPYAYGAAQFPVDFSLSASGDVVGLVLRSPGTFAAVRETRRRIDGTLIWSDSIADAPYSPVLISPDGLRFGVAMGPNISTTGTNVYLGATLTTAVVGVGAGWIDNSRLLVNRFDPGTVNNPNPRFAGTNIVDPSGTVVASPALPQMEFMQPLSANSIYSPHLNNILNLTTGETIWSSSTNSWGTGAVAATNVVFAARGPATVRIEPR